MQADLSSFGERILPHWLKIGAGLGPVAAICQIARRTVLQTADRKRDHRLRKEFEAYARLEFQPLEEAKVLASRVSQAVEEASTFCKVAMLTKDAEGRLFVAGSAGMDDLTVEALNGWGVRVSELAQLQLGVKAGDEFGVRAVAGVKAGTKSLMEELRVGTAQAARQGLGRGLVEVWLAPMWTTTGRMLGAIAVCELAGKGRWDAAGEMLPLEALAAKLARTLENASLTERLLRSEKLAGLGQLAGRVAHALNNPLTAVLGFAELIAETAQQPRVRADAATIVRESVRMQETVQSLVSLWRPSTTSNEAVNLAELAQELSAECMETLKTRGVRLAVEIGEDIPAVQGSRDRLRLVLEHLLNHAAQAIGEAQDAGTLAGAEGHAIRMTVRQDECRVQVVVSDTGPGFTEPERVFDPLCATSAFGADLGLSSCFGMVREQGGEIFAYNLRPRGSAVVVELPLGEVVGC